MSDLKANFSMKVEKRLNWYKWIWRIFSMLTGGIAGAMFMGFILDQNYLAAVAVIPVAFVVYVLITAVYTYFEMRLKRTSEK